MIIDSLFNALSGLRTSSLKLQASANNVANLQTPGFKKSRVVVGDVATGGAQVTGVNRVDTPGSSNPAPGSGETSNVDLAEEIVEQIVAKHAFKANAQVIRNSRDMLGVLLDIKT